MKSFQMFKAAEEEKRKRKTTDMGALKTSRRSEAVFTLTKHHLCCPHESRHALDSTHSSPLFDSRFLHVRLCGLDTDAAVCMFSVFSVTCAPRDPYRGVPASRHRA